MKKEAPNNTLYKRGCQEKNSVLPAAKTISDSQPRPNYEVKAKLRNRPKLAEKSKPDGIEE